MKASANLSAPASVFRPGPVAPQITENQLLLLYRSMRTARELDRLEEEIVRRGEAFFHVSGAGHEATAALALHLTEQDWLHCHYRDKALMIARGVTARRFFDGLYNKDTAHSRGRHMCAHLGDERVNIANMSGPVGNAALHAIGMAAAIKHHQGAPIVYLAVGDGTTQEGEYLEACAEAARDQLPVLFVVEDNGWAISTPTHGKTFFDLHGEQPDRFHGIPIHRLDGRDAVGLWQACGEIIDRIRRTRCPELVVLWVERISNHTNADDQTVYRSAADIRRAAQTGDPLDVLGREMLRRGFTAEQLERLEEQVAQQVAEADEHAAVAAEPSPTFTAKAPLDAALTDPAREYNGSAGGTRLTMKDALREVLRRRLDQDARVTLWGQDIEDPKGDVFGVTKGLSTQFPGRVRNSPLSESTIVGASIGRALTGERPVAFLQFADFLPLAYNQIVSDLGSMNWRSAGRFNSPVIVMVPCGAYRAGLGPFHAASFESAMAHTPGVDVLLPSTAADAAGLLNAAFESLRPTIFFYPKAALNDPQRSTSEDVDRQFVPIGVARRVLAGRDLTFVAWGNTVRICQRAAEMLEAAGFEAEVIDLRSISPWDERAVLASAEKTGRLIVVHEDNHTCGFGAEVLATVAERSSTPVAMRRITRPDTHVPCNFANQIEVLPSLRRVLESAAELLDLELSWTEQPAAEPGIALVEAIGSGPSDETVIVVEFNVKAGQPIRRGDVVASLEATKSVFELTSQVDGIVEQILVADGETVDVGAPLLRVRTADATRRPKPVSQEILPTPVFRRRTPVESGSPAAAENAQKIKLREVTGSDPASSHRPALLVGLSQVSVATGGRTVTNEELLAGRNGMTAEEVVRLTGIESRQWLAPGEDAVGLAARACEDLFQQERVTADELDLVVCATTTPPSVTPSMAYRILNRVLGRQGDLLVPAFDINAACSGYLYALQIAFDFLQSQPEGRVLVVTAEGLSPLTDPDDLDTRLLFGDAASASLLYGQAHVDRAAARVHRPELSGKCDRDNALTVPFCNAGFIHMDGHSVFREAVRGMIGSLNRAAAARGISLDDLDLVVPHQANQRIMDAIEKRMGAAAFSNIRRYGNTSSSSIPLCLHELLANPGDIRQLGLCAFGGGFTFGAAMLEVTR